MLTDDTNTCKARITRRLTHALTKLVDEQAWYQEYQGFAPSHLIFEIQQMVQTINNHLAANAVIFETDALGIATVVGEEPTFVVPTLHRMPTTPGPHYWMESREDGVVLSKSWTFPGAQRVEMRSCNPESGTMGP